MSGSLIVVKDGYVAFTNRFLKPNNIPSLFGWNDMIRIGDKSIRLTLPLSPDGFILFAKDGFDESLYGEKMENGPKAITFSENGDVTEGYIQGNKNGRCTISSGHGSFYCRSVNWDLESAATAAAFIYPEIGKIYSAAFRATEATFTPFYVGRLNHIGSALGVIRSKEQAIRELIKECPEDKTKIPKKLSEQIKKLGIEMRDMVDDFHVLAKLKMYKSPIPHDAVEEPL